MVGRERRDWSGHAKTLLQYARQMSPNFHIVTSHFFVDCCAHPPLTSGLTGDGRYDRALCFLASNVCALTDSAPSEAAPGDRAGVIVL
jgi:hypothetical protein